MIFTKFKKIIKIKKPQLKQKTLTKLTKDKNVLIKLLN